MYYKKEIEFLTFVEIEILIVNDQDFSLLSVSHSLLTNTFQSYIFKT